MSVPTPARLVVRTHDPRRARVLVGALVLAWLVTLAAAWGLATYRAAPDYDQLAEKHRALEAGAATLKSELDQSRAREAQASRSDQVSRLANQTLEDTLREREEEISLLRSDLAFYQRLVGGRGPREGLAVHQLAVRPIGDSRGYAFRLTLTQNLKKAAVSSGQVSLTLEGVRGSKLATIDWAELSQSVNGPLTFQFKYFQQIDGSVMLPDGFQPNRVTVVGRSEAGEELKQAFAWKDALATGANRDVWQ